MKEEQSLAQIQLLLKRGLSVICKLVIPLKFKSIHATNLKGLLGVVFSISESDFVS